MYAIQKMEYISRRLGRSDTDRRIAEEILDHISVVPSLTLQELAQRCFVSASTLMRFLKAAGWETYPMFREDVRMSRYDFAYRAVYVSRSMQGVRVAEEAFLDALNRQVQWLRTELPRLRLHEICHAMHEADCITFLASGSVGSVNLSILRCTLALSGKKTRVQEFCTEAQLEDFHPGTGDFCCFIKAESPGAHVLGAWILRAKEEGARVLAISNVRRFSMAQLCDYALCVDGLQAFADSYGMEVMLSLLSISYRDLYLEEHR